MHHRQASPLYSPLGCGAALLMIILLGLVLFFRGGIPFSPGPLSAAGSPGQTLAGYSSHAEFEGDCDQCHQPWQGVQSDRCELCHIRISEQRRTGSGLHGHLPQNAPCHECHTDHKGRSASINTYILKHFDHYSATGFSLKKHPTDYDGTDMTCDQCHLENQFAPELINCQQCHAGYDPGFMAAHGKFYGEDCLSCHDGVDSMIGFDHSAVYPLEGAHRVIDCGACHQSPVSSGTPNECVGCHEEPEIHAGLFGLDCVRCHSTAAWLPALLSQHTFPIDHGEQGKLECRVCHVASYTEYTCYSCHEHEPDEIREKHVEEGIAVNEIKNCIECHPTGQEDE